MRLRLNNPGYKVIALAGSQGKVYETFNFFPCNVTSSELEICSIDFIHYTNPTVSVLKFISQVCNAS